MRSGVAIEQRCVYSMDCIAMVSMEILGYLWSIENLRGLSWGNVVAVVDDWRGFFNPFI
jgi:hypothetical protein